VFDTAGKMDWSLLKNQPYLTTSTAASALPTTQDTVVGSMTLDWAADVVSLQALSGPDTVNQNVGYCLLNTRWTGDASMQPRLRIDNTIQPYCSIVPVAGSTTVDLGSSS